MKRSIYRLLEVALLSCCLFACTRKEKTIKENPSIVNGFEEIDSKTIPDNWLTYDCDEFSIRYPAAFMLDTSGYLKASLYLYTKLSYQGDTFSDNICVFMQDLTEKPMTLDDYIRLSEEQIMKYTEEPDIIVSDRKRRDGMEYHKLIYSEKQPGYRLVREQFISIRNNKVYILTLSCEEPLFDDYKETGEAIMSSFKLKNP